MRLTTVDMFGVEPGRGTATDVLVADDGAAAVAHAAGHARRTDAIETALVGARSTQDRTFGSRVFNSGGETPFGTHSLAGVAAALVAGGDLPAGEVARTEGHGRRWLWTDGHEVRVPFTGPVVHQDLPDDPDLFGPYDGTPYAGGVGRAFAFVPVADDPRDLPAPDLERLATHDLTDLTLYRWDPERREVLARVFAPGFGIPVDPGCLPAAAALGLAGLQRAGDGSSVTVRQVTTDGAESVFRCSGTVRDGEATMQVAARVWVDGAGEGVRGA